MKDWQEDPTTLAQETQGIAAEEERRSGGFRGAELMLASFIGGHLTLNGWVSSIF